MKPIAVSALAAITGTLTGCSSTCDSKSAAGTYEFGADSDMYSLSLNADSSGFMSQNQSTIGSLTWESETETGQILLHVRSATLEALRRLANSDQHPPDPIHTESGYFALSAQCNLRGKVTQLDLDEDGVRAFERVSRP